MCVVALAACRATTPNAPAIANVDADTLIEHELARRAELDYRSPMRERWLDQDEPEDAEVFLGMCEEGDAIACFRSGRRRPAWLIERNCHAGHQLSCRFTAWYNARSRARYPFSLSTAELRRGCAAGLAAECELLLESRSIEEVRFGAETRCRYERERCDVAAETYLAAVPREPARARYLLELGCQSRDLTSCYRLSVAYRNHELKEPLPGRGNDLRRYVCATRFEPYCADADTKCNQWRKALEAPNACPAEVRNPLGP